MLGAQLSARLVAATAVGVALFLAASTAAAQPEGTELYLHTDTDTFTAHLNPRQTTGIRGALFGGVAPADYEEVRGRLQQHVADLVIGRGIPAERVTMLPVALSNTRARGGRTGTVTRDRLFGGQRVDRVEEFILEGTATRAFLSTRKENVPGFRSSRLVGSSLAVLLDAGAYNPHPVASKENVELHRLDLRRITDSLATTGAFPPLGKSVPQRERFELGTSVASYAKKSPSALEEVPITVVARLHTADGRVVEVPLVKGRTKHDNPELLRQLGARGFGRYLSTHHWRRYLSRGTERARGKRAAPRSGTRRLRAKTPR